MDWSFYWSLRQRKVCYTLHKLIALAVAQLSVMFYLAWNERFWCEAGKQILSCPWYLGAQVIWLEGKKSFFSKRAIVPRKKSLCILLTAWYFKSILKAKDGPQGCTCRKGWEGPGTTGGDRSRAGERITWWSLCQENTSTATRPWIQLQSLAVHSRQQCTSLRSTSIVKSSDNGKAESSTIRLQRLQDLLQADLCQAPTRVWC